MKPEGTGSLGVLAMAEALGSNEADEGLPLRPNAPAGSIFAQILRRAGIDRSQLLISNTLWCQPKNNWLDGAPYEFSAIEHCRQYTDRLIEERRPRAILAMGNIPTRALTGLTGHKLGVTNIRGFIIPSHRYNSTSLVQIDEGAPWGPKPAGPATYQLPGGIPVIPTYHPSFLLRGSKTRSKETGARTEKGEGGMALAGVLRRDLDLAIQVAAKGWSRPKVEYTYAKSREQAEAFYLEAKAHPELPIAYDIETPESIREANDESEIENVRLPVTQIQFSLGKYTAIVFPGFDVAWSREISERILALPNAKYSWNGWSFDEPNLGQYGIKLAGIHHDLMWAWHFLQPDLPRGLQYATSFYAPEMGIWKHLAGSDDEYYGGCDVDSLHRDAEGIFAALADRGMRNTYDRHIVEYHQILARQSERGIPVNDEKRLAFKAKIEATAAEIDRQIQEMVPDAVRSVSPKNGYVRVPKEIEAWLEDRGESAKEGERYVAGDGQTIYVYRSFEVEEGGGKKSKGSLEDVLSEPKRIVVQRWARLEEFSVNSGDQIKRYIQYKREEEIRVRLAKGQDRATAERLAKYKIPIVKDKKTKLDKESTEKKEIIRLYKSTGDSFFKLVVEEKEILKMVSTYVDGWAPDKEGFVHPEFIMAPATGQLSSVNPNAQNVPKHGDLGNEFRTIIEAKPGYVLIEADKSAFHAQTLAFCAEDADYLRLAKIDVHSFVAAHMLKLPEAGVCLSWSDADLKTYLSGLKKDPKLYKMAASADHPEGMTFKQVRDEKAKRTILGIGFGQGARSLYVQNEEYYESVKEIEKILALLRQLFPKVFSFQDSIRQLAHKQSYLFSRFSYIRRFHDVFRWDSKKWNPRTGSMGDYVPGDDSEAAIAFLPANSAFAMIREETLRLAARGLDERYGLCNNIHDALLFHCPEHLADNCIVDVTEEMTKPSPVLTNSICPNGLSVEVGVVMGRNWAKFNDNPKKGPINLEGMKEL